MVWCGEVGWMSVQRHRLKNLALRKQDPPKIRTARETVADEAEYRVQGVEDSPLCGMQRSQGQEQK